ncbi:MAG: hypothetical protein A2857_02595 [Candidatus Levybacteria bacterium RIFCSPHIGHO2_01_FULL_36_15]|nr:MAG: hypothetical protein A2857_02595 [Candidatus Levybacteria bacterium RIFCSPHIGHO2_01_FULL_36_15]OGH38876.1 MAG: hypothetical protein A2905_04310 [Candidatus Levybacteria bacterium RIFCSPLOWO2_01_FULL_36_10]
MIDTVQAVLLVVIVLLTVLLFVLGVQIFFILKEFKKTVERTNRILDVAESITEAVVEPVSFISTLLLGVKTISKFLKSTKENKK